MGDQAIRRDESTDEVDGVADFATGNLKVNGVNVAGGGGGGGTPGGTGGQVQFEDAGAFGVKNASGIFKFNKTYSSLYFGEVGTGGKANIYAYGKGTFAHGYVVDNATAFGSVYAYGKGATAVGYVDNPATTGSSTIRAHGKGTFAGGCINLGPEANSGNYIYAQSDGAFAHGYMDGKYGQIRASSRGSMAVGTVTNDAGKIVCSGGNSGFALGGVGPVGGKGLYAYNGGAFAMGYDYGAASLGIRATGKGSFSMGYTNSTAIQATAKGSMQFGPGINAQAYSMSCGDGMRLNPATAPAVKRNGDMWVTANYVYVRSNGVDVKIT